MELASGSSEEAVLSSRYVHLGRPVVVHASQVIHQDHFAVRLRARGYVLDVVYEEEYATDVNKRVMCAFHERGHPPPAVLHRDIAAPTDAPRRVSSPPSY